MALAELHLVSFCGLCWMLFFDLGRIEKTSNGGHLQCLSGLARTGGPHDDTGIDRVLLIAALTIPVTSLNRAFICCSSRGDVAVPGLHHFRFYARIALGFPHAALSPPHCGRRPHVIPGLRCGRSVPS